MADDISLYLVRHAIAEERGEAWPDDTQRPLSKRGAERFREAAEGLAVLEPGIELVLSSPLVRTRQTADILSELLPGHPAVEDLPALAPGGSFEALMRALAAHPRVPAIALVGHEPGIGETAARLIGARSPVPFKKGAVCRIDVGALPLAGPGRLRWFMAPRMLRALR